MENLTDNHQGEFKTLFDRFPMNLVWKIGKTNIARHFRVGKL